MSAGQYRRLILFVILPLTSVASPLLAIPAISLKFGVEGWTALAIGQSIGAAGAVFIELGWGLTGPQRVARAISGRSGRQMAFSLMTKATVSLPVFLLVGLLAYWLSPFARVEAALVALGAAAVGLSPVWFFVGEGKPERILIIDAIPRIFAVVMAALLIVAGAELWVYPTLGLLAPALLIPLFGLRIANVRRKDFAGLTAKRLIKLIAMQWEATSARTLSALYIALPVALVSAVSPSDTALFAAVERLQRIALQALTFLPNALQSWVGSVKTRRERLRRAELSVLLSALVGLASSILFTFSAPLLGQFVFSGVLSIPIELSALSGLLIFFVCTSRATGGILLVAMRKVNAITWSAAIGAALGIPSILLGAAFLGVTGALVAEIFAEAIVLATQLAFVFNARKQLRED